MVESITSEHQPRSRGQAMVEYALILVLLAIAFGFAIAATGPAIGNVFCNVVHNIGGDTASPQGGRCGSTAPDLAGEGGNPPLFWATVTWVAANPQGETPFPTPIRRPGGGGVVYTNTPTITPTPSDTPSNTPSNTPTNTATNTPTNTPGPSATNSDFAFDVPHVDQISKPEWWRLDASYWLDNTPTASWSGTWYSNLNNESNPSTWSVDTGAAQNTVEYTTSDLALSWGSGVPPTDSGVSNTDDYGAIFTRIINLPATVDVNFTITASNYGRLIIDGGAPINVNGTTTTVTRTLTVGGHTLVFEYGDYNSSSAGFSVSTTVTQINPDDPGTNPGVCTWGRSGNANDPVSVSWQFDENPGGDTWPADQTCYLELRGYVDITGIANPILSFWDIWDFTSAGGMSVALQVGSYEDDGFGNLDRTKLNWQTVPLHNSGANYNWTREQVDLRAEAPPLVPGSEYVALRFVISSGSGGGGNPARWYIDDLQIVNEPTPTRTFTVRDGWTLDSTSQMDDFIFDGDSNRTITANPSLPNTIESWRWDLTTTNAHSGMAWDDSPAGDYQDHSQAASGQQRVHYLELKYPIDLTASRVPAVPIDDTEGDTGVPLLSFWQAFEIQPNASIRVQYTRDANDEVPDNWSDIPAQGVLIDYTTPTGPNRTNLTMHPVEIDLTNIPNALTQPFRLRFALFVDGAATAYGDGWYIDDIQIERENPSPFFAYPFVDDAENPADTADWWDAIGGEWGATTEKGGVSGSATAYADSPLTTYDPGDTQILQLHYAIDLLHDSPNNLLPLYPAASSPVMSFWHQRSVQSGVTFSVELWTASTGWDAIWTYDSAADTSFRTQNAWERVEINLVTALESVNTPKTWADIIANADSITDDDDIKVRFVFAPGAAAPADGVYVDAISIKEASTMAHRLWAVASGGNGAFVDSIESATNFAGPWQLRWYHGGAWDTTGVSGYTRTGSQALTDSPPAPSNYTANTFSVLEMTPIIDMTSTAAGSYPTLTFWTRYHINSDDEFRVEIAYQDGTTGSIQNDYNQIGGWSAWTAQPVMLDNSASTPLTNTEVVTWQRGQIDLTSFIGKKIRVRFVASVPNTTNQADGMYVDEVAFTYSPNQYTLPFSDTGQSLVNWISEGTWGLGQNYFAGTGTSSTDFGATSWVGTYFDCEGLSYYPCDSSVYTSILNDYANLLPTDPFNGTDPAQPIGPEIIADINFNWGDTDRPLNGTSPQGTLGNPGFDDSFVARWTRSVTLTPGTYSFSTISDDGVRLWIDDYTDTDIIGPSASPSGGGVNSRYIINRWGDHSAALDTISFTVSNTITRVLTLEFYENAGDAEIILNATKNSFSFTDSPNTPYTPCSPDDADTCINGLTVVKSVYPGNSSLMLKGFFSLPAVGAPSLRYQRLYQLPANNFFYVEVSTDGGFNWATLASETMSADTLLPPVDYWEQRNVSLSAYNGQPHVMIRFRLDTRTAGTAGDGIYIGDIRVTG